MDLNYTPEDVAFRKSVRAWLEHNPCTVLKKPFDLKQIVEWAHELLDATDQRSGNG